MRSARYAASLSARRVRASSRAPKATRPACSGGIRHRSGPCAALPGHRASIRLRRGTQSPADARGDPLGATVDTIERANVPATQRRPRRASAGSVSGVRIPNGARKNLGACPVISANAFCASPMSRTIRPTPPKAHHPRVPKGVVLHRMSREMRFRARHPDALEPASRRKRKLPSRQLHRADPARAE